MPANINKLTESQKDVIGGLVQYCQTMYPDKMFNKEWLLGKIQFVRSIDSVTGDKMLARFNKLTRIF